jgi:acetoacetate decarboxylase
MSTNDSTYQMMPFLLGPISKQYNPTYKEIDILVFQYLTEPEAIEALLPKCYQPSKQPSVTVAFQASNGVDFLAGNDYRLLMIAVGAQFKGEEHQLEGGYVLVMFENSSIPIILGRERLGIPKIYADITSVRILENNHIRCEASLFGQLLIGFDLVPPFKKQNRVIRKAASSLSSKQPLLGYKHIPATSFNDPPDVDYPTAYFNDYAFDELWLGKTGSLYFGDPQAEDIRFYKPIVDALKTLTVKEVIRVSRSRGSTILRNDKSYRLR